MSSNFDIKFHVTFRASAIYSENLVAMAANRNRRIAKEIADIRADPHSQVTAETVDDDEDLTHLRGSFPGPPGTPYEGGTYYVDIRIPQEYPFRPPNMRFQTKIWHPNVSSQTVRAIVWTIGVENYRLTSISRATSA